MSPKLTPQERLRLIKRVVEGKEKVARVCREAGISRVLFYRWLKRYRQANYQPQILTPKTGGPAAPPPAGGGVIRELSPKERLQMIEGVVAGEPVVKVCQDFGISRVIFYRWKKRYDEAPEGQKLEALWDKRPRPSKYYRQAPENVEKAILSVVIQYPELSTHKIVEFLPQIGGKPILGNHGVQNVLRRHNLTTYQQRLAYSLALRHVPGIYDRFLHAFQAVLGSIVALPARRRLLTVRFSAGFLLGIFTGIVILGARGYLGMVGQAPAENKIGLVFASIALTTGSLFFLYSLKYYLTVALVLGFSRHVGEASGPEGLRPGGGYRGGLQPNLDHIKLERFPFISIHLPLYNERKVVDRILTACTSMDYENYEVVVVDDSTDETTQILKDWKNHPRVKIIHRESREGFKGGALKVALENADPKTEFVLVFDADFIPYPDTITQFLKYFQSVVGSLTPGDSKIACVQGYQWHVLNKSENWITRGVRSEYAGSYVVERSGTEVLGALKQIAGSVYMIRADLLRKFGWQTSITEDFQLTLRLYEQGYKVVYTPYVQAPSECVATIKRLVRQRMRWAEGHSYNIRKLAFRLLASRNLNLIEKLELIYLSPYYLQAFFFMIGTLSWLISETVFRARLPFWTSLWGWSLVLTNMFSLPLMNTVGLFLEESEEKDYLGILSFVALSYLLVPFQAYASVKGFLEREEGPWFRTPKTGHITDIFTRGRFYRWVSGIIPGRRPAPAFAQASAGKPAFTNPYLALATANNRFNNFSIPRKRVSWLAQAVLAILLIISTTFIYVARDAQLVYATNNISGPLKLSIGNDGLGGTWPAWGNFLQNTTTYGAGGALFMFRNTTANSGTNNYAWYTALLPTGSDNATIPSGAYYLQIAKVNGGAGTQTINFGIQLLLTNNNGTARAQMLGAGFRIATSNDNNIAFQYLIGTKASANNITSIAKNRMSLRIFWKNANNAAANIYWLINNSSAPTRLVIPSDIIVPEFKTVVLIILVVVMPILPSIVQGKPWRRRKNIFAEIVIAWRDLIKRVTGMGEEELDLLPV